MFLLPPVLGRQRHADLHPVLAHVDPLARIDADERPADTAGSAPALLHPVSHGEQSGVSRSGRRVRVVIKVEECPVSQPILLQNVVPRRRKRLLGVAATQVANVVALELEFRDVLGERDRVLVVDSLPSQRVEEEFVVQEQLLLDFRNRLRGTKINVNIKSEQCQSGPHVSQVLNGGVQDLFDFGRVKAWQGLPTRDGALRLSFNLKCSTSKFEH